MKEEIKRQTVLNWNKGILLCMQQDVEYEPEATLFLSANKRKIQPEANDIYKEASRYTKEYDKEKLELAEKYAEKKEGKAVIDKSGMHIIAEENAEKAGLALIALNKKHKEAIDKKKAFLDELYPVDFIKIKNKHFPKMNPAIADLLFELRED